MNFPWFKKQRLEETKTLKIRELTKKTPRTAALQVPPGNSPPGVADCSFYSTNKARMQALSCDTQSVSCFQFWQSWQFWRSLG
jgi:hypothetical protein